MSVVTPEFDAAIAAAEVGVVAGVGVAGDPSQAVAVLEAAERLSRLAAVARVDAIAEVDAGQTHRELGHVSAARMASHLARSSTAQAARDDKIRRMIAGCDTVDAAWRAGALSEDQAGVLARAFANPRVRAQFVERQRWLLRQTERSFPAFERRIADWVRLVDSDGPAPKPDPTHESRDTTLAQDHFSGAWHLRTQWGTLDGSANKKIFDAYVSAETLTDWQIAREIHGDATTADLLPRTAAQRRADALSQIFADAASNPNSSVPIDRVHNVVWSDSSLEAMMRRHFGTAETDAPVDLEPIDIDDHRCHSLDGHPLHPDAAFADFLVSSWPRVVTTIEGTCLDISAKQRFYTGLARLGVMITHDECFWPGCHVPATSCEIDHRIPAARGGLTTQHNGAPACHKHNRLKERGYTVVITADGDIEITTPNGYVIPQ